MAGPALKREPYGEWPAIVAAMNRSEAGPDKSENAVFILAPRDVDRFVRPARGIEDQWFNADNPAVFDRHAHGTLGPRLAHAAALQVPRKDDPRIARDDFRRVDMAQRPIVITEASEFIGRARRIAGVAPRAVECRMQNADIEPTLAPRRIGLHEIVRHLAAAEAAAMQRHPELIECEGFGLAAVERPRAFGVSETPRHHAVGIVVALGEKHRNAGPMQMPQGADEEQAGCHILPVTIEHIAGDDQECRLAVDGFGDEPVHRLAPRRGETRGNGGILPAQPGKRTVDMEIGRVDEIEAHVSGPSPNESSFGTLDWRFKQGQGDWRRTAVLP